MKLLAICLLSMFACGGSAAPDPAGTTGTPPAPRREIDPAYARFAGLPPSVASGALGTYLAVDRSDGVAIGLLERAAVTELRGSRESAIATSTDRIGVSHIQDGAARIALLDGGLNLLENVELGPGDRDTRVVWNADASEWVVAWTHDELLTTREISALRKLGMLVPIDLRIERAWISRVTAAGNVIERRRLDDGAVVDLVVERGTYVLTRRFAEDLPCRPELPTVLELRVVTPGTRKPERQLVRNCGLSRRTAGRLLRGPTGLTAFVAGCDAQDEPQLIALRFNDKGSPAGPPLRVAPLVVALSASPLFDAARSEDRLLVAVVEAASNRLAVTTFDAGLSPISAVAHEGVEVTRAIELLAAKEVVFAFADPAPAVIRLRTARPVSAPGLVQPRAATACK